MAKIGIDIKGGVIKKDSYIVGIDLGTTNSLVAFCDTNGNPKALSQNSDTIVPSVIYFNENNQALVGSVAKDKLVSNPERTIYSVKRLLGRSYNDLKSNHSFNLNYKVIDTDEESLVKIKINEKVYNPIELSSLILSELKMRAETVLNGEVSKAVITVPAYFNDAQRQATRDAGKMAGLDVLRIINEPTAASLAYGIGLDKYADKTVAVYDLGGGTFDISILRIESGVFEVLSTHGDTFLGGDDFDKAIIDFWCLNYGISHDLLNKNTSSSQQLRLVAEDAKKYLSDKKNWEVNFESNIYSGRLSLNLNEFNKIIEPLIGRTIAACEKALHDSGVNLSDIDEVVMVGGSTRVPAVQDAVKKFFQKDKLHNELDPDEVVALGAAIEADILSGNRKDILLLDVTPLSLGIETLGGLMDFLINRNSKIPCKASRQYTTSKDGQTGIIINIYQGERELVADNRKLAEFELKGVPAMPAGFPKIEVSFLLDADGILMVEAMELRSSVKQEIKIKPAYGLTDEQVETMLLESLTYAKEDLSKRQLQEAKTEAQQLIDTCIRFIEKNKELLSLEEVSGTENKIRQLTESLTLSNKDVILSQMDELNTFTKPFAERVMDISVAQALKGNKIV